MARVKQEEAAVVRDPMRSMYFSNDIIGEFMATSTAGQVSAVRRPLATARIKVLALM